MAPMNACIEFRILAKYKLRRPAGPGRSFGRSIELPFGVQHFLLRPPTGNSSHRFNNYIGNCSCVEGCRLSMPVSNLKFLKPPRRPRRQGPSGRPNCQNNQYFALSPALALCDCEVGPPRALLRVIPYYRPGKLL